MSLKQAFSWPPGCDYLRQMDSPISVRLSETPLDPAAILGSIGDVRSGAIALFVGTVRDHSDSRQDVSKLVYDAYTEHVEASLRVIAGEASERWPITAVVVEHRVGEVVVGQPSVVVAVSTAHRSDAFEACRYIIDELKQRAPIWKQEHWPGGTEWIEGA